MIEWIVETDDDEEFLYVNSNKQVPQLVRCKDCNFLEKNTGVVHFPSAVGICKKLGIYPSGDWFCANGVKKE